MDTCVAASADSTALTAVSEDGAGRGRCTMLSVVSGLAVRASAGACECGGVRRQALVSGVRCQCVCVVSGYRYT